MVNILAKCKRGYISYSFVTPYTQVMNKQKNNNTYNCIKHIVSCPVYKPRGTHYKHHEVICYSVETAFYSVVLFVVALEQLIYFKIEPN